jgi:hypothetical protein
MTRVFISYSHQDEQYRVELDKHMALLKREHLVDVWSVSRAATFQLKRWCREFLSAFDAQMHWV